MKMSTIQHLILLIFVVFFSCKKDSDSASLPGNPSDYYPLKIGSYHIYLVDSTYYNDVTMKAENYQFQIKEEITDTFYDLSNRLNYRLEKYYRSKTDSTTYEQSSWNFGHAWYVTVTNNSIERVEKNVRIVNLTNPIKNDITWDGNVYNFKGKWNFVYQNFQESYLTYSNCVKVLQRDNENLIEKQYFEQYFAKGIGIVEFNYIDIGSQDASSPKPILERIEKGVKYKQVLIDYYIP